MKTTDSNTPPSEVGEIPAAIAQLAASMDAQLGAEGAALPGQAPAAPPPPTAADRGAELSAMLQAVTTMAEPVAPYIPRAYTPEVCDRIGLAMAAVAEKRGWNLDQLMSPEVMLAFVTVPPTLAAVKMAKDYYAWREDQERKARAAPAPAPANDMQAAA